MVQTGRLWVSKYVCVFVCQIECMHFFGVCREGGGGIMIFMNSGRTLTVKKCQEMRNYHRRM